MVDRKFFLQIQSNNIMYPKAENMIIVPIRKRREIIMSIQVYLISRMNFDYKENDRNKAFLANPKHNIMYPNVANMIVVLISNRKGIIMSIQVCHISRMNLDYKENGGKKSFSCKSKASISCIPLWRT